MKDNFLILSGPWSDSLPCPTKLGEPGGVTLDLGFLTLDLRSLFSALLYCTLVLFLLIHLFFFFFFLVEVFNYLIILFDR